MKKQFLALIVALLLPPLCARANILAREDGMILLGLTASTTGAVLLIKGSDKNGKEGVMKVFAGFSLGLLGAMIILKTNLVVNNYDLGQGYGLDL